MRSFIHDDDLKKYEREILSASEAAFDVNLKLFDGRVARFRGARGVDNDNHALDRIVAFIERAPNAVKPTNDRGDKPATQGNGDQGLDAKGAIKATAASVVPSVAAMSATTDLIAAMERGDIVAAFQPIISLSDEKIAGYETLARWQDQEGDETLGPEDFVKTAEAAGKGGELVELILHSAASFLAGKTRRNKKARLFVTINVSYSQIVSPGFADLVAAKIEEFNLPENALVIELTESDAVADTEVAGGVFRALKEAGAALAFDDFGAGFSCLSNLHKYDFDYLKIDKSFAAELDNGGDKATIVKSLTGLGKDLGMRVIAEGIESKAGAKAAREIGCEFGQGFAFGEAALEVDPRAKHRSSSAARLQGGGDGDGSDKKMRLPWRTGLR